MIDFLTRLIVDKFIFKLVAALASVVFAYLNLDKSWVVLPFQEEAEITIESDIVSSHERKAFGEPDIYTYKISNIGSQPIDIDIKARVASGKIDLKKVRYTKVYSTINSKMDVNYRHKKSYFNESKVVISRIDPGLAVVVGFVLTSVDKLTSPKVEFDYNMTQEHYSVYNEVSPLTIMVRRLFVLFCMVFIPFAFCSELFQYMFDRVTSH